MQRTRLLPSALVVVTVLLTAACSGGGGGTGRGITTSTVIPAAAASTGAQPVRLTVGNGMSFDPSGFTVRAGEPIQLTLQNTGPDTARLHAL